MFNVGVLLRQDQPDAAIDWWRKAADAGNDDALDALQRVSQLPDSGAP
jgi:hypothetical protein